MPNLKSGKNLRDGIDTASVGIEMGAAIMVGYLFGHWLDGQLDSAPWFTAFFLLCGFGAAAKAVVRVARRARKVMNRPEPMDTPVGTRRLGTP